MEITTKKVRENGLDKFYTNQDISKKCIDIVGSHYKWTMWDIIIEPSAGNGSFLMQIPSHNKLGIDISPEHDEIIEQDFLTFYPPGDKKNILVIGNPPFGKVSSTAIKFFNHASKWSTVIAFIIPRTFRRTSIQNRLDKSFHLEYDEDIPINPCSFNPPMAVKCCFQIWERKDILRKTIVLNTTHSDWDFVKLGPKDKNGQPTPPEGCDFVVRAYGGKCGEILEYGLEKLRPRSWHWIKSNIDKGTLMNRFKSLDYSISLDTARQNSLGQTDLVKLYQDYISKSGPPSL